MKFLFTAISGNAKTGPIPVVTSPKQTCPDACAFKSKGCYAAAGVLNIHWNKITNNEGGIDWKTLLKSISKMRCGTLWRLNQAGDFVAREGDATNNSIDATKMTELVAANKGKSVIAYTHKPVLDEQSPEAGTNREIISKAVKNGFNINLSANNLAHADKLLALGIAPVVSVVPMAQTTNCKTPNGARVVVCPASVRDNVTCSDCGLCARSNREYVIGFPAHGNAARTVDVIAKGS